MERKGYRRMSRDRLTPCKFYISKGECTKNRDAEHNGYCQKCDKYRARAKEHHVNRKKQVLEQLKREEME